MVNFINSWAQGIILAIIISCIIELILPDGNNKKYVKTIIGIYILFVIIYPFMSVLSNKKIDTNEIIDDITNQISKFESADITLETNGYIEETYREKLKEDISQKLKDEGYDVDSLDLYIEIEDENTYGQIKSMQLRVSKIQEIKDLNSESSIENEINQIQIVDIKISNEIYVKSKNNLDAVENITEKEIENLKDYLTNTYGIAKEKMHINE